jgi:hypothetical protein
MDDMAQHTAAAPTSIDEKASMEKVVVAVSRR